MVVGRKGQEFSGQLNDFIFLKINMFFLFIPQKLDAGINQNRAENIQNPVELMDQISAGADKYAAENDRSQNAPEQSAVVVSFFQIEVAENEHDHEKIVHGQHFFRDVGAHEFRGQLAAHEQKD